MDMVSCNASVDFNVPGKSNAPPRYLTMTVWKQSRRATTGVFTKHVLVFTDPSGTVAPPSMPLKTWVQLQQDVVASKNLRGVAPKGCIKSGASLVFQDQQEGNSTVVTFAENEVALAPFGASNERFSNYFCNAHLCIFFSSTALRCAKLQNERFVYNPHLICLQRAPPVCDLFVHLFHHLLLTARLCACICVGSLAVLS